MNQQLINAFPELPDIPPFFNFSPLKDENKPPESSKDVSASLAGKNETIRVILADDDDDDRELFKEAIEEAGLEVNLKMAKDGEDLFKVLNAHATNPPDVIFLDLNMPNKNGKQCLKEIRKSPQLKDIPVVIYSTSSSMVDINDTYDDGANLYVSKPTFFKDLLTMTRTVLTLDWEDYKPKASRKKFVFSIK